MAKRCASALSRSPHGSRPGIRRAHRVDLAFVRRIALLECGLCRQPDVRSSDDGFRFTGGGQTPSLVERFREAHCNVVEAVAVRCAAGAASVRASVWRRNSPAIGADPSGEPVCRRRGVPGVRRDAAKGVRSPPGQREGREEEEVGHESRFRAASGRECARASLCIIGVSGTCLDHHWDVVQR